MSIVKYATMMVDIYENIIEKRFGENLNNPQVVQDILNELSIQYPIKMVEEGIAEVDGVNLSMRHEELWRFLKNTDYPLNMLEETFVDKVMYNTRHQYHEAYIRELYKRFFKKGS